MFVGLRRVISASHRLEIEDVAFIAFLGFYLAFISYNLGRFSPHQDEARTCLAGVTIYDFGRLLIENPSVLFKLRDWVLNYNECYEGFGWAISNYGPILYLIEATAYSVFGISLVVARSVTVLLNISNLIVFYFIGKKLGSARIGLIAAMLLALSPHYFIAGKQAYPDIILCFMTSLVMYFLMISLDNPTRKTFFILGLTIGLSLITKIFSILFLPAIFIVFNLWNYGKGVLKSERFWAPTISCSLVYGLWFIPSNLLGRSSRIYAGVLSRKLFNKSLLQALRNALQGLWLKGIPVIAPFTLLSLVYLFWRIRSKRNVPKLKMLIVWFFHGFLAIVLFDMMSYSDWGRYPIMTYLPAALLATSCFAVDSLSYLQKLVGKRQRIKLTLNSLALFILVAILSVELIQGLVLEERILTLFAPYDEIANLILSDPKEEIRVLTYSYSVNFYLLIKDQKRRVVHKTLFKFSIENLTQYAKSIGFPDYIVVTSTHRLFKENKESLLEYYRLVGEFQMNFYDSSENILVLGKKAYYA